MLKNNRIQKSVNYIQCCLLLFLLFTACTTDQTGNIPEHINKLENLNAYPPDTRTDGEISFSREEVFGSAKGLVIGSVGSFAVDDSGRVFISDPRKNTIHVFGSNARYITNIGRKGKGPGEFYRVDNVQIQGQNLYAYDLTRFRYNVFSLDSLRFRYTVNLANNREDVKEISDATLLDTYVRDGNSFLAKFSKRSQQANGDWGKMETGGLYYLLDRDGNISSEKLLDVKDKTDVLVPFPGGATDSEGNQTNIRRMGHHPQFYGKSLMALTKDNHIYRAWSNTFLIKEYNSEGEYLRAIYYPVTKVSLSRESATAAGVPEFIMKGWHSMERPEAWPVLNDLKIDDQDRLWVATTVEDMNVYEWWVLKNDGALLARFQWPRTKNIEVVKNGYVYTREPGKKEGIKQVVRYKFQFE